MQQEIWYASTHIISIVTAYFAPKYLWHLCSCFTCVCICVFLSNNIFTTHNAKISTSYLSTTPCVGKLYWIHSLSISMVHISYAFYTILVLLMILLILTVLKGFFFRYFGLWLDKDRNKNCNMSCFIVSYYGIFFQFLSHYN